MQHEFTDDMSEIQELTFTVEQARNMNKAMEEAASVFSLFRDIANETVNTDFLTEEGKNGLYVIAEKMASQCFSTYLPMPTAARY